MVFWRCPCPTSLNVGDPTFHRFLTAPSKLIIENEMKSLKKTPHFKKSKIILNAFFFIFTQYG
jgi:hypothetical protein